MGSFRLTGRRWDLLQERARRVFGGLSVIAAEVAADLEVIKG
jgi:hypothetical protein